MDKHKTQLKRNFMAANVSMLFEDHFKESSTVVENLDVFRFRKIIENFGYVVREKMEEDHLGSSAIFGFWKVVGEFSYFFSLLRTLDNGYVLEFEGCGFNSSYTTKTENFNSFVEFFRKLNYFYPLGHSFKGQRLINYAYRELFESVIFFSFSDLFGNLSCGEDEFYYDLDCKGGIISVSISFGEFFGSRFCLAPFEFRFEDSIVVYPMVVEIVNSLLALQGENDFGLGWNI